MGVACLVVLYPAFKKRLLAISVPWFHWIYLLPSFIHSILPLNSSEVTTSFTCLELLALSIYLQTEFIWNLTTFLMPCVNEDFFLLPNQLQNLPLITVHHHFHLLLCKWSYFKAHVTVNLHHIIQSNSQTAENISLSLIIFLYGFPPLKLYATGFEIRCTRAYIIYFGFYLESLIGFLIVFMTSSLV